MKCRIPIHSSEFNSWEPLSTVALGDVEPIVPVLAEVGYRARVAVKTGASLLPRTLAPHVGGATSAAPLVRLARRAGDRRILTNLECVLRGLLAALAIVVLKAQPGERPVCDVLALLVFTHPQLAAVEKDLAQLIVLQVARPVALEHIGEAVLHVYQRKVKTTVLQLEKTVFVVVPDVHLILIGSWSGRLLLFLLLCCDSGRVGR